MSPRRPVDWNLSAFASSLAGCKGRRVLSNEVLAVGLGMGFGEENCWIGSEDGISGGA